MTSQPVDPPLTDALRAQALKVRGGGHLYAVDPAFDADGEVPPHGLVGAWEVDQFGSIVGFTHNPNYRPSPKALEMPAPRTAAEAALQAAATGYGSEQQLLDALLAADLYLRAEPGATTLTVMRNETGPDVLEACTSPELLPATWPGAFTMTGRELAAAVTGLQLRVNPGQVSVTIPIDALSGKAGA